MKKKIVKLTESDLEKLVQKIIKEEEGNMNAGATKKMEKVTDKAVFEQFAKYLEGRPVMQQVEMVLGLLDKLPLGDDFYKRFKMAVRKM